MKQLLTLMGLISTTVVVAQTHQTDMNVNTNGMGVDMNVNVNVSESYSETHTTTTTTTTQAGAADHYVMPGYSGPIGCPWPMDESQFAGVRNSVASKTWDESRLTIAKQVVGSNCLTAAQVRDLMTIMEWEETKLDFAKFAYAYTFDLGNYYKLNDAFEWEDSIEELNMHINGR